MLSFGCLLLPLVSHKLLLVIGAHHFPYSSLQQGGKFCTDKNKHVWMCLSVLRELQGWSDHLSVLLKINNLQWYPCMWTKSTATGSFVSELANVQWNQACNQVIQIAFGNIYFYWLLWKCLIIEYHVFQCAVKQEQVTWANVSEWMKPKGASLIGWCS